MLKPINRGKEKLMNHSLLGTVESIGFSAIYQPANSDHVSGP